jgi:hypothetical protein
VSVKCFLVERTGNTRFEPCSYPFCKEPGCGNTREEWRRTDTGETTWNYPAEFGPGAMWPVQHKPGECWAHWTNCSGTHIEVILPDGGSWDIDSRASNCTLKDDGEHRCWIKHGNLPFLTVDKAGTTCRAGAGSIISNGEKHWHGFLRNGELVP